MLPAQVHNLKTSLRCLTIAENLRTINMSARTFDEDSINAVLQNVAVGFRANYHSILRSSPGQLVFGRDMIINATYVANWKTISDRRERERRMLLNNARENSNRLSHEYQPGDKVVRGNYLKAYPMRVCYFFKYLNCVYEPVKMRLLKNANGLYTFG